jgi:hypothetical protein
LSRWLGAYLVFLFRGRIVGVILEGLLTVIELEQVAESDL